jgi:protein LSM14
MQEATRAATAAVAAAMAKLPQPAAPKKQQPGDAAVDTVTKKVADMKPYDSDRGPRGAYHGRGGRGGHRGGQYQAQAKKVEVPSTDFDFESANAKFNKEELAKEAIASGSPPVESDKKPVNGTTKITNGAPGGGNHTQVTTSVSYDKSASFFDNISSESRDREEGTRSKTSGREWRSEEEKKNMETFGQGSVDGGYRGGYRGRGRGRGYGPRGRGSYVRGYGGGRGRGGFRAARGTSQPSGVPAAT